MCVEVVVVVVVVLLCGSLDAKMLESFLSLRAIWQCVFPVSLNSTLTNLFMKVASSVSDDVFGFFVVVVVVDDEVREGSIRLRISSMLLTLILGREVVCGGFGVVVVIAIVVGMGVVVVVVVLVVVGLGVVVVVVVGAGVVVVEVVVDSVVDDIQSIVAGLTVTAPFVRDRCTGAVVNPSSS